MKQAEKVRYAVVGIGHIAQVAVLPAFKHARQDSELVALVTGDPQKSEEVARKYPGVEVVRYEDYESLLSSGRIDAVYVSVPNHRHLEFAEPALRRGIHVLCEKPLALKAADCKRMGDLAGKHGVKLMTAYRLHFEASNLKAIERIADGDIGEPRYFTSSFSFQVEDPENIRLRKETGGGPIWDIGVYCINAARYLFRSEPGEVFAFGSFGTERRFREVPEMMSVSMKFPKQRLASFICSFGAADASYYEVYGTKGRVRLENAYEYYGPRTFKIAQDEGPGLTRRYRKSDQFASELHYFTDCIKNNRDPEPSALEGFADVRIIEAILKSMRTGKSIRLNAPAVGLPAALKRKARPTRKMRQVWPAVGPVKPVRVISPHE